MTIPGGSRLTIDVEGVNQICWQVTCEAMVIAVCSLMSPQTRGGKGRSRERRGWGVPPLARKWCHSCVGRIGKGIKGRLRDLPWKECWERLVKTASRLALSVYRCQIRNGTA